MRVSAHLLALLRIGAGWLVCVSAPRVARVEGGPRGSFLVRNQDPLRNSAGYERRHAAKAYAIGGLMKDQPWQTHALSPFGLEVLATATATHPEEIPTPTLKEWIARDRYVLLRGFAPLSTESMTHLAL